MHIRSVFILAVICRTVCSILILPPPQVCRADDQRPNFQVGYAERDITPQQPMPMWGYGARHDALSQGVLDPLFAKAIVVEAGTERLAIVSLDLGRGPTKKMMERIRAEVTGRARVRHVLIVGSHTHHGPVIELVNLPNRGQGKFDAAAAYAERLPEVLIEAVVEAAEKLRPARMGVASRDVPLNRNRHTKRLPKAVDPFLGVIRFDDLQGNPMVFVVNYTAHPVMTDARTLKFSADYPGFLKQKVEQQTKAECLFLQGASGDMSPSPGDKAQGPRAYGELLADHVLELSKAMETSVPKNPSLKGKTDRFQFRSRVDFGNPGVALAYQLAFFLELINNFTEEFRAGIEPELNTILLNDEIAVVTGSGEFFCNHAVRLRQRAYVKHLFFMGYCNGHDLYFPTIEGVSEGGYGADVPVSPVEVGAGERMMDQALINIYTMTGKIADAPPAPGSAAAKKE